MIAKLFVIPLIVLALLSSASAYEFYVASAGNDDWPGTQDKPFASVGRGKWRSGSSLRKDLRMMLLSI